MRHKILGLVMACTMALTACQSATSGAVTITTAPEIEETSAAAEKESTAAESTAVESTEAPTQAVAKDWKPDKPLTLIVAYKEGSSTDVGARLLAQYAQKYTGQPIEIKNIPANSGMTGWETLANAAPDGSTLGFINMPNIFTAMDNGGKFTIQDFTPVCNHLIETSVVVVADTSPYQTVEELIEANKAADASGTLLNAATNGVQASNDIGAALLSYNSGRWNFKHIAYGSTSDQIKALFSGECDWSIAKISDVKPYLDSEEKLRVLAIFDTKRDLSLPDVPTLQELGYPTGWYGSTRSIVAPKNTDPNIVKFYTDAFQAAMEDAECIAAHKTEGFDLSFMDANALAERIDERFRFNSTLLPKLFEN